MNFNDYSETFLHFHTDDVPELIKKYLSKDMESLVDLGAGDGALLIGMKTMGLIDNFKTICAVDLSEKRCERLSQIDGLDVFCGDVTSVPELDDDKYDFVVCTQVIEHVDQYKLLDEIKRILKPDGKLYIASLIKKRYGFWYYKTKEGKWGMDPTHLREYASKEEFEGVLTTGGFSVIETNTYSLKLSVLEFLTRRVVVPIFKPKNPNSFFVKNKFFDFLRRNINIHPPGYLIIETVATMNQK